MTFHTSTAPSTTRYTKRSRATASEPAKEPLSVEDLATTMYNQLGIVADKELLAPGGRPIEIVKDGKVVKALLA